MPSVGWSVSRSSFRACRECLDRAAEVGSTICASLGDTIEMERTAPTRAGWTHRLAKKDPTAERPTASLVIWPATSIWLFRDEQRMGADMEPLAASATALPVSNQAELIRRAARADAAAFEQLVTTRAAREVATRPWD